MLATMIIALTQAQPTRSFTDFYLAAVTMIPLLFVALAVEGHFIKDLLKAFDWAQEQWSSLVIGVLIAAIFRRRNRFAWPVIIVGAVLSIAPAALAGCIVAYATASEVVAILALYQHAAAAWMATFVLIGTVFLIVMVAVTPAIAIARSMIASFSRVTVAASAPEAQQSGIAVDSQAPGGPGSMPDETNGAPVAD